MNVYGKTNQMGVKAKVRDKCLWYPYACQFQFTFEYILFVVYNNLRWILSERGHGFNPMGADGKITMPYPV